MNKFDFVIINGEEYQVIEPETGLVYHVPTHQNIRFGDLRGRAEFLRRERQTQWWEIIPVQKSATPLLDARAARFFDLQFPGGGGNKMLTVDEILLAQSAATALRVRYVESGQVPPPEIDALIAKIEALGPRITFAEAAAEFGISASTLRYAALDGRLEAEKRGRDWTTTASAVRTALAEGWIRRRRGRPRNG